ncbi:MAG TPA: hypothetical protein VJ873_09390, partial [bacterium]|nr:hypothetical protein [bacterium]
MSKQPFLRLMVLGLTLVFSMTLGSMGCKPKKIEVPPPAPTPTPVIPPGSVVFVQRGHLVRMDLASSQTVPLTSGKSTEWFPACSPKGDQVVYWSNAVDKNNDQQGVPAYNLWKINMDGTNRIQLTFDEANLTGPRDQNLLVNNAPGWSQDGKKIIYSLEGDIWTMDPDGFNPETLLAGHKALCPVYSPDGKSILFISMDSDPVFNLWSMNLTDRTLKKLTNYSDWSVGSPSFSADGKKIIYNLYRENQTQVYTVEPDGSSPLNLTTNSRSLCPRFAQQDRKILYCSYGTGDDVGLTLYLANANGTDAKPLAPVGASSPSWAPAVSDIPSQ